MTDDNAFRTFEGIGEAPALTDEDARTLEHVQQVLQKQTLLLETMRALTSTLVLKDVLELAARSAGTAMDVFSADINVYSTAENTMTEVAYWARDVTPEDEAYMGTSISLDERPSYYPFLSDPRLLERQLDDPDFPEDEREIAARWGERSSLTAPLVFGGRLIGLLGCMEKRWKRVFTEEDKELFRLLAVPAALAIHNAQTYRREEMRNQRLVGLLGAAQCVAGALDRDEVARCTEQEVPKLFPARTSTARVRFFEAAGMGFGDAAGGVLQETGGLLETALRTRAAVRSPAGAPPQLIVPLFVQDSPVGYVDLRDDGRVPFSQDEGELLEIFVTQAETALENARLYRELERQAITDGLTGLHNQRYFYERLRQETTRATRLGTPFALLMVDLDDFKRVNDLQGHAAGDEVLRSVARLLSGELRRDLDLAARYGGDEFAVILLSPGSEAAGEVVAVEAPEAGSPAGRDAVFAVIAERIRASLAQFPLAAGGAQPIRLTLSGGIARFPEDAADAEGLVLAADKALYLAKRLGKNRVESFR